MGVPGAEAVGILTLSPREAAMIAGDFATKAASVQIGFVDRFTGALVIQGSVASVEEALRYTVKALHDVLGFAACEPDETLRSSWHSRRGEKHIVRGPSRYRV